MLKPDVAKFRKQLKNWRCHIKLYFKYNSLTCSCGHTFYFGYMLKNRIILHEIIILKTKRPTYTAFICTSCKNHEKIPIKIILQMDMMNSGPPSYPPMFDCEKCGGLMKPVYFFGYTGIEYTYDVNYLYILPFSAFYSRFICYAFS